MGNRPRPSHGQGHDRKKRRAHDDASRLQSRRGRHSYWNPNGRQRLGFRGSDIGGRNKSADTALNMPDFRASERAFQLLTQVSGRAGRGRKPGHVIVQTFSPEHESVAAAATHDYEAFYRREIVARRELFYPPFSRLANIVCQDEDGRAAEGRLRLLATKLGASRSLLDGAHIGGDDDLTVLGPAPCPLGRLKNRYRWHLLLKARDGDVLRSKIRAAFSQLHPTERTGITIDIDPMSLL